MRFTEYGEAHHDVVILLHGGGLSWWNFRTVAELLSHAYHVVLPILDGHGGSDHHFVSIEENAARLIAFIDETFGGSVLCIGGVSLGGQILTEMLFQRGNICRFAIVESASVLPDKAMAALIAPVFSASYGLISQKWFARLQASYLGIPRDLFEDYYRDTCRVTRENLITFMHDSVSYGAKDGFAANRAAVRICVGGREQRRIKRSSQILHERIPGSVLDVKKGLRHGEYSMGHAKQYAQELMAWVVGKKDMG